MPLQDTDPTPSFGGFGLSSEKGIKNMMLNLLRYSRAVVGYLNRQVVVLSKGPDGDSALLAYGLDSVLKDVAPHLVKFASPYLYAWKSWIEVARNFNALFNPNPPKEGVGLAS